MMYEMYESLIDLLYAVHDALKYTYTSLIVLYAHAVHGVADTQPLYKSPSVTHGLITWSFLYCGPISHL